MAEVVKLRRPATRDHLRAKPRAQRVVEVHLDADARQALTEAHEALGKVQLRAGGTPKPPGIDKELKEAQAKVAAAQAAMDESTVQLVLRAVPRRRYEELEGKHPPTPEQIKEWEEQVANADERIRHFMPRPAHDPDGLAVALIAASAVMDPPLSEADVEGILEEWSMAEGAMLKTIAFNLNNHGELVELGKGGSPSGSNGTSG